MFTLTPSPAVALVDFNMTDARGTVPALRSLLTGLVTGELFQGQRVIAQDADGNTSEAVVHEIHGDVLDLFLLPTPALEVETNDSYLSFELGQAFVTSAIDHTERLINRRANPEPVA